MSNNDTNQGSPMLVPIPYKMWKEIEEVMQHSDLTRGPDVEAFLSIICITAVSDYIDLKRRERKRKNVRN